MCSAQASQPSYPYSTGEAAAPPRVTGPHPHVLEMSGFSAELSTAELRVLLDTYQTSADIRWVDDTHALVVFRSASAGMPSKERAGRCIVYKLLFSSHRGVYGQG